MKQVLRISALLLIIFGGISNPIFSQCDSEPNGIEIDPANNFIYWSDKGSREIFRGNLDGTGAPTVLYNAGDGVGAPRDVAIDVANNEIFWTEINGGGDFIFSGHIQGSGIGPTALLYSSFVDGLDKPNGIDINPATSELYWSEVGNQAIVQGDNVATALNPLFLNGDGVEGPRGIQIDVVNGFVY